MYKVVGYHKGYGGTESLNTKSLWRAIKDCNRLAEWECISHYELYIKDEVTVRSAETIGLIGTVKLYIRDLFLKPKDYTPLEDYDPFENLCKGNNVTKWRYTRVCPNCLNETTHQERMTSICLKCGIYNEKLLTTDGAVRKIYYKGGWRENLRIKGSYYIDKVEIEKEKHYGSN